MAKKPPSNYALAAALCRQFPGTPSRTLAKRLYAEHRARFANLESARKTVQEVRGANGKRKGSHIAPAHRVPRPPGQAGWKPECPPSAADQWEPLALDLPAKVLSLSDTHFPYHEKGAIVAAVRHAKKQHRPNVILLNGDFGDFYSLSKYEKDPGKIDFDHEADVMEAALAWLRSEFPKARFLYKMGNHDERLDKYYWNKAPEIFASRRVQEHVQLQTILNFDKYGIERVDDQPIMVGHLPILHGHELQKGLTSPVNQARGAFLKTIHTLLVGHGHRTSTHCEPDMFHREITTWSQGCLCNLTPQYARFNKWNWGYALGVAARDRSFNLHNYRISADYEVRAA